MGKVTFTATVEFANDREVISASPSPRAPYAPRVPLSTVACVRAHQFARAFSHSPAPGCVRAWVHECARACVRTIHAS